MESSQHDSAHGSAHRMPKFCTQNAEILHTNGRGNGTGEEKGKLTLRKNLFLSEKINKEKPYIYYYHPDPKRTIFNICSYYLNAKSSDEEKANWKLREDGALCALSMMNFDAVYGPSYKRKWKEILMTMFRGMLRKKKNDSKTIVHLFILQYDIKRLIPEEELVVPSIKQKLLPEELAFYLKTITHKLLKWKEQYGDDYDVIYMARGYFLKNFSRKKVGNYHKKYKKATGRSLNTHKLARMNFLLNKYAFLTIWITGRIGQFGRNAFSLGENNYYAK